MSIQALRDSACATLKLREEHELKLLQQITFHPAGVTMSGDVIPPNTLEEIATKLLVSNAITRTYKAARDVIEAEYNKLTGTTKAPAEDKPEDTEPVY